MAGNAILSWPSLPGNAFTIRASGDLTDWSEVVAANLPAFAEPARRTQHEVELAPGGKKFFTVHLENP